MYVEKEEFEREINDIKDNHLAAIYAGVTWIDDKMDSLDAKMERLENRFYRILGVGIGVIAIVLAILEVMG